MEQKTTKQKLAEMHHLEMERFQKLADIRQLERTATTVMVANYAAIITFVMSYALDDDTGFFFFLVSIPVMIIAFVRRLLIRRKMAQQEQEHMIIFEKLLQVRDL